MIVEFRTEIVGCDISVLSYFLWSVSFVVSHSCCCYLVIFRLCSPLFCEHVFVTVSNSALVTFSYLRL